MFTKHQTEVLVIGAGPVGLLTALRLTDHGVDVQIVDKHRRTGFHSYGLAVHSGTLELLDEMGLAEGLIAVGHQVDKVVFYDVDQPRAEISLAEAGGRFPFVLAVPQSTVEDALESKLQNEHIHVQWNHRLQGFRTEGAELSAELARLDQVSCGYPISRLEWIVDKIFRAQCRFIVGADGYHSFVRERMGIPYKQVGAEQIFSVFEVDATTDLGGELRVMLDEHHVSALWPLADGRCRFSFQIDDPDRHRPTLEYLNELIQKRAPWFPAATGEIGWASIVRFDRRLAEAFGRDQIWLAGDAAHLTGPVGVQSMNTGLQEGWDLGDRLGGILRRGEPLSSLAVYNAERQSAWDGMLGINAVKASASADDWVRDNVARILPCVPGTGDGLRKLLAQIGLEFTEPRANP